MATRAPIIPSKLPTLHIYRHLLREVSYLPPALSRHIGILIRRRFHQHIHSHLHVRKRLADARSALRRIRAANYGERTSMSNLMLKAFGRSSIRRRLLVSEFLSPEQPQNSKALEALLQNIEEKTGTREEDPEEKSRKNKSKYPFLDKWDKPKLLRFLKSQQAQQGSATIALWGTGEITSLDENSRVPDKDTWGRDPSPAVVRAKQAAYWKRNASKIMPPLGKGEWDLLERLSLGSQAEEGWKIPERRTPAKPSSDRTETVEQDMELERHALQSTAYIENRKLAKWRRYYGAMDTNPFSDEPKARQASSDRWYRRAYTQVWKMTPHVEQDPNTLTYKFKWGKPKARNIAPTQRQMLLFEGVDAQGKKPAAKQQDTQK